MKKVVSRSELPTRLPVLLSLVVWLLLDRFDPEGWIHGAAWCFVAVLWIGCIVEFIKEKEIKIFD